MDPNEGLISVPSDEEIKNAVFEWLEKVDASSVTKKDLKRQIENAHGWDLETKRSVLSEALMEYFEKNVNGVEENEPSVTDIETPVEEEVNNDEDDEDEQVDLPVETKKRKSSGNRGFQVPVQLSTKLSDFLDGEIVLLRPEVRPSILDP
jgi:hypothetical protein